MTDLMSTFSSATINRRPGPIPQLGQGINVGKVERIASLLAGGALLAGTLNSRFSPGMKIGLSLAAVELIWRGATGQCPMYSALGVSTAERGIGNLGIRVEKAVTINKPPRDLYNYWRNLENLPRFMRHLISVQTEEGGKSHWVAKAPAGQTVEWDAEIINDRPNKLIAWRSLEGADVDNVGSVNFEKAPGGRGTIVKVLLEYNPPAGVMGATVAKLFGEEPAQQVEDDLRRFKQILETGEFPTTVGQPHG